MTENNYEISLKDTVSECVDDEIVVINMRTGNYYSLRGEASEIWKCLQSGLSLLEALELFSNLFPDNKEEVAVSIQEFAAKLAEEGLIHSVDVEAKSGVGAQVPVVNSIGDFSAPIFEKFTDMHQFIQADPIHDVDEGEGWPVLREE